MEIKFDHMRFLCTIIIFGNIFFIKAQFNYDSSLVSISSQIIEMPYHFYAMKTTDDFFRSYINPNMNQSLKLSNNFYSNIHYYGGKIKLVKNRFVSKLLSNCFITSFDLLAMNLPFGNTWLHEEYHRTILTNNKINSFNEINLVPIGEKVVSVSNIDDFQLSYLFNNNNKEFRRLLVAGSEAQNMQIEELQKQNFFYNSQLTNLPLYWMNTMTNVMYVHNSTTNKLDLLVDKQNITEGTNIKSRDFAGPDFTSWVDALYYSE